MIYPDLSLCLFLLLSGICLWQFSPRWCHKLGTLIICLSSCLFAYVLSGSLDAAILVLLTWIIFPLWEMVFMLRQLRIPQARTLTDARAPRDDFEEIDDLTDDLKALGFEQVDECRVRPALHEQYYRLFLQDGGRIVAALSHLTQGPISLHYLAFSSISEDRRTWITWDYPTTYGLLVPETTAMYRVTDANSVEELYQRHLDFLEINSISLEQTIPFAHEGFAARDYIGEMLNQQIDYNVQQGLLAPASNTETDAVELRYSWRGTLFVARKVLLELLF